AKLLADSPRDGPLGAANGSAAGRLRCVCGATLLVREETAVNLTDRSASPVHDADAGEDTPFLWNWTDQGWARLLIYVQTRRFHPKDVVLHQDESDRSLSILVDGSLEVLAQGVADHDARRIATIGAGSVMGEQAFLDGLPRSAEVRAITDGEMLTLTLS